jgi:HK97 family phage major capsid protein
MRQEWGALGDQMKAILDAARAENRDLTSEEQEKFDRIAAEADKLESEIRRLEAHEQRQARMQASPAEGRETAGGGIDDQATRDAYGTFLRTGQLAERGLVVSDDTTGGYLAPIEIAREIIKAETEFAPFRRLARIRPTTQRAVQWPTRTGQFAAVWAGETGTRDETTGLSFGAEEIPTHEMSAVVDVSNQDLEDSMFDLERFIQEEIAEQFAVAEAAAFMTGNGVKKPWGVATDAAISNTKSGSNGDFDADDLIDLLYGLKTLYISNATWLFNRTTLRKIRKLKANNEYIWSPGNTHPNNIVQGLAPTILDRPYMLAPELDNTGSTGAVSVVVGDFRRGYIIVDRVAIAILRDPFTQATQGNVRFVARKRVGGQVVLAEAIRRLVESQ